MAHAAEVRRHAIQIDASGTAEAAQHFVDSLCTCATYTALPDRRESGGIVGAFSASVPLTSTATKPSTMNCTYDKATFLLQSCMMQLPNIPAPLTIRYTKWNDPDNVVDAPASAPAAPPPASPAAPAAAASAPK